MLNKLAQIRYRYVRVQHPDRRSLALTIYGQSMLCTPRDKLDMTQCQSWRPLVIGLGLLQRQQLCNRACLGGFEHLLSDPNTVLFSSITGSASGGWWTRCRATSLRWRRSWRSCRRVRPKMRTSPSKTGACPFLLLLL